MQNYEPDVSQLLALYQQLEDDIIADMVRRMLKMGLVSESTAYQAQVLQTAGLLYDDIIAMIAQRTDASVGQVKALFEDAGVETVEIDNEVHEEAGEAPVDIRQDSDMKQVLEAGYKKTLGTMKNLVSTTASTTQKAFIDACDRAYMQVSSGAFSYQQAIRIAVKNLADSGAYVTYPTGHKDRIDVAVRRCVLTGVGQTAAAVAKKRAEDSGCDYMELTAHSGARPDHAKWQGQLVRIRGNGKEKVIDGLKVFTLHEIGYGKGDGFKGWNCRHNWHPYYPGLSTPNYTQEELKKLDEKSVPYNGKKYTEYEVSQMQRTAERKARALKRRTLAAQTAMENAPDEGTRMVLQTEYMVTAAKLKDSERILNDFCQQTGRRRDTFREQVAGFGKSEAQKAVHATKKHKSAADTGANSSGHAVDVTPPTQKDNGGTGKTYQAEEFKQEEAFKITKKSTSNGFSVNRGFVNSKKYHDQFTGLTEHRAVNESIYQQAKRILEDRDGKDTERMAIIDARTGELLTDNLSVGEDLRFKTGLSFEEYQKIKESGKRFLILHNHPSSTRPSITDILTFWKEEKADASIVVGHDGTVYVIANANRKIPLDKLYEKYYDSYKELGYDVDMAKLKATNDVYASKAFTYFVLRNEGND